MSHDVKSWLVFYGILLFGVFLVSCSSNSVPTLQIVSTNSPVTIPSVTPSPSQTSTVTPVSSPTLPPATLSVVSTMDAIVVQKPELKRVLSLLSRMCLPALCLC